MKHIQHTFPYLFRYIFCSSLLLCSMLFVCLSELCAQNSHFGISDPLPKYETRAVWLTTLMGLDWPRQRGSDPLTAQRQRDELCRILDHYKQLNINTVILQTRLRGNVIYKSRFEPFSEVFTGKAGKLPSYDPLQFCIEECHKRGMELHAWVVCIPLGELGDQKRYGREGVMRRHPELCKTVGGRAFMVPGNPATADYIAAICREIAERYDIDGISLDYIRYPEQEFRFSDNNLYRGPSSGLADWRRENITRIVRRIHDEVKAVKPWVKLSSSPVGKYNSTRRYSAGGWNCFAAVYQDPRLWLRENLQDMLFPMMYFRDNNFYPFLLDWHENSYGHPIVPGLGIYLLDPHEGRWTLPVVRAEMHAVRRSGIGGIAFFRSDFLTRNLQGLYDCCRNEFFPRPALTAQMTWMPQYAELPSVPAQLKHQPGRLQWKGDGYCYNVYGSNEWPVDCSKAENLLATRILTTSCELEGLSAGRRYYAVTACNRYGAESEAVQMVRPVDSPYVQRPRVPYLINRELKGTNKKKKRKK